MHKIIFIAFFTIMIGSSTSAQTFNSDGSMVIREVSTDKRYGLVGRPRYAVKVGTVENEYAYLKALRGPQGQAIQYHRRGSCCGYKNRTALLGVGQLDVWEIRYEGLDDPIVLYIDGYTYEEPRAPMGLSFRLPDDHSKK